MAYTFGASGAMAHAGNTNTTPLSVDYPTGISAGHLLLLAWSCSNQQTPTPTGTWTKLASRVSNLTRGDCWLYGTIATGSESGSISISGTTTAACQAQIARFSGAPASITGIVHASDDRSTGSGLNILGTTALTISQNNCLVIAIGSKSCNGSAIGLPTGFTNEIAEGVHSTTKCMAWDYVIQTTATNITQDNWAVTTGDVSTVSCGMNVALLSTVSAPTITSVDSDDDITSTQTGVVIAGTNFEASQGTGSVKLIDGTIESTCTVTAWGASSITVTIVQGNVRFGSGRSIKVTTNGGLTVSRTVALSVPSGTSYVNVSTLKALTFNSRGTPTRLTPKGDALDATADCTGALQFKVVRLAGSGTVTPAADGRLSWADTATQIGWYWHNGTVWSSVITWDLRGLFPEFNGANEPDRTYTQNVAITTVVHSTQFSFAESLGATYSLQGGAMTGLAVNSGSGDETGTPTVVTTYSARKIRVTNTEGSYAETNAFSRQIIATPPPFFTGSIPNLSDSVNTTFSYDTSVFFTHCTAFSIAGTVPTGLTFHTGTGIIDGTSTVVGIFDALVVTGTGTGSPAVSNSFSIDILPVGSIAVPNLSGLSAASANSSITGAALVVGLVGAKVVTDTAQVDKVVAQSPDAGDLVVPGTLVNYSLGALQNPIAFYFLPTPT